MSETCPFFTMQLRMYDHIVIRKIIGYGEIKHFMKVTVMKGHPISYRDLNIVLLCEYIKTCTLCNNFSMFRKVIYDLPNIVNWTMKGITKY